MIIKRVLLTIVLATLGFCAVTLPYLVVMLVFVSTQHSFDAVYPATFFMAATAVIFAPLICLYAWQRHPRSLRMLVPFLGGALLFLLYASVQAL